MTESETLALERRKANALLILAILATAFVLQAAQVVLVPLFVAVFLSYIGMPVIRMGNRLKIPVWISIVLFLTLFTAVALGIGFLAVASMQELIGDLPELEERLRPLLRHGLELGRVPAESIDAMIPSGDAARVDWQAIIEQFLGSSRLVNVASEGLGSLMNFVANLALVLVFLVFILLDRGHGIFDDRIVRAFSSDDRDGARPVLNEIHSDIERYILAKTGISILTGLLAAAVISLFGVKYAVLFGSITFLLNFIPNIGSIAATVPPILVALVNKGELTAVLPLAACLTVLQVLIGNLLEPIVFGRRLKLNAMTVLVLLFFWGWLWGVWGMVLAVPLGSTIRIVLARTQFEKFGRLMSD